MPITYYTQIAGADIAESAQELMAMKFAYIKYLTKLVANEKVTNHKSFILI